MSDGASEMTVMGWFWVVDGLLTPVFLALSPLLSYGDQTLSMHRRKSSAGFSLDIPLIMLVASFLKIFYWPYARFDTSLLVQAIIMVFMQFALLKIALDNRPSDVSPFAAAHAHGDGWFHNRPYRFWQWRSSRPYWKFLFYLFCTLAMFELMLSPMGDPAYPAYSAMIGYLGLAIEAILPIPQILANARSQSCQGLRISVIASWLAGDFMKILWFFTSVTEIPWPFKLCGLFQACCDVFLGCQFVMYGDKEEPSEIKGHPLEPYSETNK